MSTTTNLDKLKINYLTQEQYEDAVENEEINENELYFTPGHNNDAIVPVELTQAEYDALTTEQKNNGMVYCVSDANGTYLTAGEVSCTDSLGNVYSVQERLDSLGSKFFETPIASYTPTDGVLTVPMEDNVVPIAIAYTDRAGWNYTFSTPHTVDGTRVVYVQMFGGVSGAKITGEVQLKLLCFRRW